MSYTSVLFNKNFTFYLIGIAFSNIGSAFTTFVFPLMILKLTGSAFQVGIVSALSFIPYAILGLPATTVLTEISCFFIFITPYIKNSLYWWCFR